MIFLFVFVFIIPVAHASEIQSFLMSSSGGVATSSNYTTNISIGEGVVGTSNSSSYVLYAGFLPIFSFGLATVPDAPTGLSATSGDQQVSLSWTAPSDDGDAGITDYIIECSSDGGTAWTIFSDGISTTTSSTVTGLTNSQEYQFRVSAVNSVGTGTASDTVTATPSSSADTTTSSGGSSSSGGSGGNSLIAEMPGVEKTDVGSSSNGGSGGSSPSGEFGVRGDESAEVQLYEISWNLCNSNIIRVLAGSASLDLGVKIRTAQSGVITAHLASEQPYEDIMKFEANISQDESFVLVQAESIIGRSAQIDKQTINLDPCGGRVVVREYDPIESDAVIIAPVLEYDPLTEPEIQVPAPFVDESRDPQYYIDRYNSEPKYREWFDEIFPEYTLIYEAVGLDELKEITKETPYFVDPNMAPQHYVDRYYNEPQYKEWFCKVDRCPAICCFSKCDRCSTRIVYF